MAQTLSDRQAVIEVALGWARVFFLKHCFIVIFATAAPETSVPMRALPSTVPAHPTHVFLFVYFFRRTVNVSQADLKHS